MYHDRLEIRGALADMDLSQLPDPLLARIAQGEHPLTVLASAVEARGRFRRVSRSEGATTDGARCTGR